MAVKIDHKKFEEGHYLFKKDMEFRSGIPFTSFKHPTIVEEEISHKWRIHGLTKVGYWFKSKALSGVFFRFGFAR